MKKITLALAAVLFLLAACGSSSTENEAGEWQTKQQSSESVDVHEVIQDFDFSVQEYPIDTALYTAEVDREFKSAFYAAISNQTPMVYRSDGAVYFRGLLGDMWERDEEFFEELREAEYRFADMDGDGLPELAMQWEQELCILSYDRHEKKVHLIIDKEISRNPAWEGFISFAEAFGDVPDEQPASAADVEEAQKAYEEFLAGGRIAVNVTITDIVESADGSAKYLVYDVSGDGVPELHIQTGKKYYILTYRHERLFVWLMEVDWTDVGGRWDVLESGEVVRWTILDDWEFYSYWEIQPSAKIISNLSIEWEDVNGDSVHDETDIYKFDEWASLEWNGSPEDTPAVTMEEWQELTADYLETDESGRRQPQGMLAWSVYEGNKSESSAAVLAYRAFLAGERSVGSEDIYDLITPTGEPDKRYHASYCIWDVDGDEVPELHILSGREYTIYSYEDGEMVWFQAFFSRPWEYVLLENGAFLNLDYQGYEDGEICYYYYFELDENGEEVNALRFEWKDTNGNNVCDGEDAFRFADSPCTSEDWLAKTEKYLYVTEEGGLEVKNPVAWTAYVEQEWR
ncbi:MAG: hypothetical protein HDR08_14160 [Lachnospiraceae bacterium]|nr:hypothetical protein [Lachnospiraceae bacterium]